MPSVIFVCTANVCRSPMAMGLFLARLGKERGNWRVESAGTWASDGQPAAENTLRVVAEQGVDLREHRSRPINGALLEQFDLILAMEQNQKEALRIEFPGISPRIFLLSEMIGSVYDIKDPMSGDFSDFQNTAEEIEDILEKGFDRIRELAVKFSSDR